MNERVVKNTSGLNKLLSRGVQRLGQQGRANICKCRQSPDSRAQNSRLSPWYARRAVAKGQSSTPL